VKQKTLSQLVGKTDIYIIDQIMKERYLKDDKILDAGCGEGRNLKWFYLNGFDISGIDTDVDRLQNAKLLYPKAASQFQVSNLEQLPYKDESFNHVLCSAVLHFAKDETHFYKMFSELSRVLKIGGSLFIRVASNIGLDGHKPYLKESQTNREGTFFITRGIIKSLIEKYPFEFIDPFKTTNVQDERAMTTLVMRKI
jgi:ubiquinone/menaquinone biosynthesis C-methylase UbiE